MKELNASTRIVVTLCASQILATCVNADPTSDEIQAMKQQIQALSQKLEELEQKHNAETAIRTNAPFITAGQNGFSLQSADTNFVLKLSGFAQVDARDYISPAAGAKDTFYIRRMRAIASGSVYHDFEYYMQTDFSAGNTATTTNDAFLQDAYVNIHHWDALQFQA